jgi:hypothetical protein
MTDDKKFRRGEYPTGVPPEKTGMTGDKKRRPGEERSHHRTMPINTNQYVRSRNATCTALGKSITRSRNTPKITR